MVYAYVPEHFLSCKELSYLDKLVYIRIVGFCRNEEYNYSNENNNYVNESEEEPLYNIYDGNEYYYFE